VPAQTRRPDCLPQISAVGSQGIGNPHKPFYVDVIDLAEKFHIAPHIIYEEWPVEWIDRIFLVHQARAEAAESKAKTVES